MSVTAVQNTGTDAVEESPPPLIAKLPEELLTNIQKFLNPDDLTALSLANKQLYQAKDFYRKGVAASRFDDKFNDENLPTFTLQEIRELRALNSDFKSSKMFTLDL